MEISRASTEATNFFRGLRSKHPFFCWLRLMIACVSLQNNVSIVFCFFATTQNDCNFLVSEIELGKSTPPTDFYLHSTRHTKALVARTPPWPVASCGIIAITSQRRVICSRGSKKTSLAA